MAGKRIPDLDPLSGASSANDDKLVIYDVDAGATKRIDRSQLAAGLVGDLPYSPSGSISATTVLTAIAELETETAKKGAAQTFTAQQEMTSGLVLQSVAASAIATAGNPINTADKVQGKVVYDTTNNRLMVASGSAAVAAWYSADGSVSVTPA